VMFLDRPAPVDAVAAQDAMVLYVPKSAVYDEIDVNPVFARRLLAALSQRVEALVAELERLGTRSGRARLIQYLLRHATAKGEKTLRLPATKAAIASQLRITPEYLSRLLRELAAAGLVRVNGRELVIADVGRLTASIGG